MGVGCGVNTMGAAGAYQKDVHFFTKKKMCISLLYKDVYFFNIKNCYPVINCVPVHH